MALECNCVSGFNKELCTECDARSDVWPTVRLYIAMHAGCNNSAIVCTRIRQPVGTAAASDFFSRLPQTVTASESRDARNQLSGGPICNSEIKTDGTHGVVHMMRTCESWPLFARRQNRQERMNEANIKEYKH